MSEPMTDDQLASIERLLMHGVIGTDPANVSGATTDDVAESAIDLLTEVRRLRDERTAMLDLIEAGMQAVTSSQVDGLDSFTRRMDDLDSALVRARDLMEGNV